MVAAYGRPPITEAVVEFRIADTLPDALLKKASRAFSDSYPLVEPMKEVTLAMDVATGVAQSNAKASGYKLTRSDALHIVQLRPQALANSVIAPYPGWEDFIVFVHDSWTRWRKIVGQRQLTRIGVRFLNRIDIPGTHPHRIEDYLCTYPCVPSMETAQFLSYSMQVVMPLGKEDCEIILNTGPSPSPLIGYAAFLIDYDIGKASNLPSDDDSMFSFLNRVRAYKDEFFESLITDKARELFR